MAGWPLKPKHRMGGWAAVPGWAGGGSEAGSLALAFFLACFFRSCDCLRFMATWNSVLEFKGFTVSTVILSKPWLLSVAPRKLFISTHPSRYKLSFVGFKAMELHPEEIKPLSISLRRYCVGKEISELFWSFFFSHCQLYFDLIQVIFWISQSLFSTYLLFFFNSVASFSQNVNKGTSLFL